MAEGAVRATGSGPIPGLGPGSGGSYRWVQTGPGRNAVVTPEGGPGPAGARAPRVAPTWRARLPALGMGPRKVPGGPGEAGSGPLDQGPSPRSFCRPRWETGTKVGPSASRTTRSCCTPSSARSRWTGQVAVSTEDQFAGLALLVAWNRTARRRGGAYEKLPACWRAGPRKAVSAPLPGINTVPLSPPFRNFCVPQASPSMLAVQVPGIGSGSRWVPGMAAWKGGGSENAGGPGRPPWPPFP